MDNSALPTESDQGRIAISGSSRSRSGPGPPALPQRPRAWRPRWPRRVTVTAAAAALRLSEPRRFRVRLTETRDKPEYQLRILIIFESVPAPSPGTVTVGPPAALRHLRHGIMLLPSWWAAPGPGPGVRAVPAAH